MKREDLFEAIGGVAEERLELSERTYKRQMVWIRYGGIAAGICLVVLAAIAIPEVIKNNILYSDTEMSADSAGKTYMDDSADEALYDMDGGMDESVLQDENMQEYPNMETEKNDLMEDSSNNFTLDVGTDDAISTSAVTYVQMSSEVRQTLSLPEDAQITEEDLGEYMGTVQNCENDAWNGCKVYYSAKYPTDNTICIVDLGDSYIYAVNREGTADIECD